MSQNFDPDTVGCRKRVAQEYSLFHFFHYSLYLDGTKRVCTERDVPGTKTSGRNGKMWKGENSGETRFLHVVMKSIYCS